MKIKIAIILVMLGLFLIRPAFAAGVGLPPEPSQGARNWSIGVEESYMFDRDLERQSDTAGEIKRGEVDSSNAILAVITYAFADNFCAYGKIGTADLKTKVDLAGTVTTDTANYEIDYNYGVAYAGGIKGSMDLGAGFRGIIDFQYFGLSSDLDSVKLNGSTPAGLSSHTGRIDEFGITGLVSYGFKAEKFLLFPYVGVRGSLFRVHYGAITHDNVTIGSSVFTGLSGNIHEDDNVGVIAGVNLKATDSIDANIEVRFIDEMALSGRLTYRF